MNLKISQSEKQQILEMHRRAVKNNLWEQNATQPTGQETDQPKNGGVRLGAAAAAAKIAGGTIELPKEFVPISVDKNKYNFWFQYKDKGPNKPGDIVGNIVQYAGSNSWEVYVSVGRHITDGGGYNDNIKNVIESMGNGAKWKLKEQDKIYAIEIIGITEEKVNELANKIIEFDTKKR
jgi:hypothetical protein